MMYPSIDSVSSSLTILLSLLSLSAPSLAANNQNKNSNRGGDGSSFQVHRQRLNDYWVPSPNQHSQHVLNLNGKKNGNPISAAYAKSLRQGSQVGGTYGYEEVDADELRLTFATEVMVGGKSYELVIDTGSSDTWLPRNTFQCAAVGTGDYLPQASCEFSDTYTPSASFTPIENLNYHVTYTSGQALTGTFGTERVQVAGILVEDQQIAVVDNAQYSGDGITAGVLGLAFPADTKAFKGNDYRQDYAGTQQPYSPIFTSMYTEGNVAPLFSIALDRNSGGVLAIGGLPPVSYFPVFASSPFELLSTGDGTDQGVASLSSYTLYSITVQGFDYRGSNVSQWSYDNYPNPFGSPSDNTQVQTIVDTGVSLMFLPKGVADAVNALFTPRYRFINSAGYYVISCNATAPNFGVKIGFETFYVNPKDMVVDIGSGTCVSGIAATGSNGASFLGQTFLKNVLAVFDVGAQMMRFAAREYY